MQRPTGRSELYMITVQKGVFYPNSAFLSGASRHFDLGLPPNEHPARKRVEHVGLFLCWDSSRRRLKKRSVAKADYSGLWQEAAHNTQNAQNVTLEVNENLRPTALTGARTDSRRR